MTPSRESSSIDFFLFLSEYSLAFVEDSLQIERRGPEIWITKTRAIKQRLGRRLNELQRLGGLNVVFYPAVI